MGRRWAVVLGALGAALALASLVDPLSLIADDSWFYVVIGRNVADGHGITFSRVTDTNGFQPLWGAIVSLAVAGAHLVGANTPLGEVRAVLLVGWGLLALAAWRLDRLLRTLGVGAAGCAAAGLLVVAYLGGLLGTLASEANLHLLALVLAAEAAVAIAASAAPSPRSAARLGALVGVVVLARLDSGFTALALLAAVGLVGAAPARLRWRAAAVAAVVAAAVTSPYLAWNLVRFGHFVPISGTIKLDLGDLAVNPEAVGPIGFALLALALVAAAVAWAGRRPPSPELVAAGPPLVGGTVSLGIYLVAGVGRLTDLEWYRMPHLLAAAVLVGLAVERVAATRLRWASMAVWAGAAVALPALVGLTWIGRLQGANHDHWHPVADLSEQVGRVVPADEVIATLDFPGVLAAYSHRRVLALDGLTGDYAFQDDLRDIGGACALARRGVRWITVDDRDRLRTLDGQVPGPDAGPPYTVVVSSWLHHVDVGTVDLLPGSLVIEDPATGISLWRIDPRCP